ncbi:FtsQ-type POTRA domain-containing protein [Clostridium sp. D2Q-14]|uniref:cell division protein FtsQ/DivIB n=1 Tax=Anaeromonas gelatinilytica TaxID=2683194 RepID=UPI00193C5FA9|nr:FtsQ-type POTRA domain-containing protein [Anaeromonas gelatinilytica]MBS4535409.1 FtsQ-type POTRA domain-containing protein [Anaeromonas gelatinilytica]
MTEKVKVDNKLKRKKRLIIIIILIFLISILSILLLTQTTFFNVENIEIKGNSIVKKDEILMASGINEGENIFRISIKKTESSLLKHPYIKEVKINRRFPNKIIIDLVERKDTLAYEINDTYIIMDSEGYVVNILSEFKNKNIPLIKGDKEINAKVSEKIDFEDYSFLEDILYMLSICNQNDFSFNIHNILQEKEGIILELNLGTYIAFGRLDDVEYKLRLMNEIIKDLQDKEIFPEKIYLNKGKNPIIVK